MRLSVLLLCSTLATACLDLDEPSVGERSDELYFPVCIGAATYYVDADAASGGNGTSTAPFRTIYAALSAAKQLNHCSVTTVVSPGYYYGYWGTLTIDRQTTVRGTSRSGVHIRAGFYNASGALLRIENATIENASRRAVQARHSRTELASVTIRATRYAGVDQEGGSLDMRSSSVYDLRGESSTASAPAVKLRAGAQAVLRNVSAMRNPQGLVAYGAGTYADVRSLYVYYTDRAVTVDCAIREGHAAVEVRDGATVSGQDVWIYQTAGAAFDVYRGGLLSIDGTGVWQTRSECPPAIGAIALMVSDDGIASVSDFTFDGGGYGLLTREAGGLDVDGGTIKGMLDAAICAPQFPDSAFATVTIADGNAAAYCPYLPSGTVLPPPTPVEAP